MIQTKAEGGSIVVSFEVEKLDASNADQVKDLLKGQDFTKATNVRIEMDKIQFIDSSGVGALLSFYKSLSGSSADVVLSNPTPGVLSVLELLRLHRIFTIKTD